jgi:hypothetical protein
LQISQAGVYTFEFSCQPIAAGQATFVLPLVPALKTVVDLDVPPGRRPVVFGSSARTAVVIPAAAPETDSWRIETGPGAALGLTFQTDATQAGGLAVWSAIDIRGQQAAVAATVRPSEPWDGASLTLHKDPSLRITSLVTGTTADPLGFEESTDGRAVTIRMPAWLLRSRADLVVRGVTPGDGATWRLPLIAAPQSRWTGGGFRVTVDPANGVNGLELDDCRVVTTAVADRWPLPSRGATAMGSLMRVYQRVILGRSEAQA